MIAIDSGDAAMAVAHVFAQTNICHHDKVGTLRFDRSHGFLNDAILGVRTAGFLVLFARNSEKQHGLQPEFAGPLRFHHHIRKRELINAGHATDRLSRR